MVRDPATIAVGVVLPVILILLFGFGLSLDVKNVPLAVVLEDSSAPAQDLLACVRAVTVLPPAGRPRPTGRRATDDRGTVDGILTIPADFARRFGAGDAQRAAHSARQRRQSGAHHRVLRRRRGRRLVGPPGGGPRAARRAAARSRSRAGMWFNSANDSHYFLVPGLIVLVMTLIGAFLTAMVVAREWERGTFEALFVTPVRSGEILLGKTIPYFGLGVLGLLLCVAAGKFLSACPSWARSRC